jgi:DNA helicase-2/ATP-dependent DNA helicase PcrA
MQKAQANGDLSIGRTVKHAKFGFGTVLNFEGDGESARVQVKFKTAKGFSVSFLI